MAIGSISAANSYLSQAYKSSQSDMALALARLGTNRRYQTISQDAASYAQEADIRGSQGTYNAAFNTANHTKNKIKIFNT